MAVSDKQGKNNRIKGVNAVLGAVARQFSIEMVCYTRTAIIYYFIALTLEESPGALSILGLKQLSPTSASNNTV